MVESHVALDRTRNFETWGAQEADPFSNLSVERNQHLRPKEDVLETSSFTRCSPSATIVPLPTALSDGFACITSVPKFAPVCTTGLRPYPSHCKKWTM